MLLEVITYWVAEHGTTIHILILKIFLKFQVLIHYFSKLDDLLDEH